MPTDSKKRAVAAVVYFMDSSLILLLLLHISPHPHNGCCCCYHCTITYLHRHGLSTTGAIWLCIASWYVPYQRAAMHRQQWQRSSRTANMWRWRVQQPLQQARAPSSPAVPPGYLNYEHSKQQRQISSHSTVWARASSPAEWRMISAQLIPGMCELNVNGTEARRAQ